MLLLAYKKITKFSIGFFALTFIVLFQSIQSNQSSIVFAETVTGGGYTIQQVLAPLEGRLSGNGYSVQGASQPSGGLESGGGYIISSALGRDTPVATSSPPIGGGGGGGGGGYFVYPKPTATGTVTIITPSNVCASRIVFSGPIDFGLPTNAAVDVKKLELFLNIYEHEKIPVNGIYEKRDVDAVKRWQQKYKAFILDPMRLKEPTGTVYTLSQRQIERQTTKACGQPITVTACPYFNEYVTYGDRGDAVKKIQLFLTIVRDEKLPVSGVYGPLTRAATKRFQQAYNKDICNILKLSFISGNWNEATRIKANQAIGCDKL